MFSDIKAVTKHFFIYGMGSILGRIASFILLPLYTHYLSTSEYGTLDLLELTTYIIGMFLAAGISHSLLRFYYDSEDPERRKLVVSTSLISISVVSLLGFVILSLSASSISELVFKNQDYITLFRLVFLSLMFSLISEIPLSLFRAQQRSVLYTIISLIRLVLTLSLNILFIVGFKWGIKGIILSSLCIQALSGVVLTSMILKQVGLKFSVPIFKEMLKYGIPLIPEGAGYFVLNFADRFILQRFTNLSEVGLYSLGYKFGMIISPMITDPFLSIWRPKMFETSKREDAKNLYSVMFTYFMFVEIFAGLFISILIIDALKIISSPEFYSCYKIVPLISFSYILMAGYFFVQMGLLQRKKTKHVAYIVLVAAGINVGLNLLLVPRLGMWGSAISTILSFIVLFIFNYAVSNTIYYIKYQYLRLAKMLVLAVSLYFLASAINIDSFILSISTRTIIALSFPLLLYVLRFYTPEEIQKIKNIIARVLNSFRSKGKAK